MNAVEIEEAVSELAGAQFDANEFPYAFLAAFGNKETTIKRLRTGSSNSSDIPGGVLQRNNIHVAVCKPGEVDATLRALRESPKTLAAKAKFVLATDGAWFEAEDIGSGETIACAYPEFARHFGFFLPLAGISTVLQIAHNPIDIKATGRLEKLYIQLLKDNEDWGADARRPRLNQFMARLIFCFFAESTGIFLPHLFTETIRQMTDPQSGNTHEVIAELFRAMNTKREHLKAANFRPWAEQFPYANGSLFAGKTDCPRFSRMARCYLLRAGELDWKEINPDIFGSMIQAVADDDERGSLGLHYTSVPNILKVLNPLFLDDLREQLDAAGTNVRKLKNLRRRIASIRVFDPACGSGNFLVIAYIEMRKVENEIIKRLSEKLETQIKLENLYGIEIRSFPVEIAKLSLLIAEFQCNVRFYGEALACLNVLPLHKTGQIHVGNALRMDWLKVCAPAKVMEQSPTDLFDTPLPTLDFEARDRETYICGNPPYKGSSEQSKEMKKDLEIVFGGQLEAWKSLDYVAGWFIKALFYLRSQEVKIAFVSTNSICQGQQQVSILWPALLEQRLDIFFAHSSFKWANLAAQNAGVTVVVIGLARKTVSQKKLYVSDSNDQSLLRLVDNINAYIVPYRNLYVSKSPMSLSGLDEMDYGSKPADGGHFILSTNDIAGMRLSRDHRRFVLPYVGTSEFIDGTSRFCLWITDGSAADAGRVDSIKSRIEAVREFKLKSSKEATKAAASRPHAFVEVRYSAEDANKIPFIIPIHTGENREYLPVGYLQPGTVVSNAAFALYGAPMWNMALIASRLHLVWIATVCGKLETRYRYSNTLGWNTFPVPNLTENNKSALSRCAEEILLAREAHFPATIADLYDGPMRDNLKRAHEQNDETLERIYIGRRFRNDTERLEKLFELYTKMIEAKDAKSKAPKKGKQN